MKSGKPILLKKGGDKPPLFVLPVARDDFSNLLHLQQSMTDQRAVYGVPCAYLFGDGREAYPTLEEQGKSAARAIIEQFPSGPYILYGYSAGAAVAYETALQLTDLGREVSKVILVDPPRLPSSRLSHIKFHILGILSPIYSSASFSVTFKRALHLYCKSPINDVRFASTSALLKYHPRPSSLPFVVMISALDQAPKRSEKQRVWKTIAGDQLEIWNRPGNHTSVIGAENAQPLARQLEDWLNNSKSGSI
jgi:thioesterase domain-containing protein